jgi:RimJ/RimL family protein N-acetyltransferase
MKELLNPAFWCSALGAQPGQMTYYGPSSLSFVSAHTLCPNPHPFVRLLRRRDAGEVGRFARILQAREPDIFHAWAIGGRVAANEQLWGAYLEGRIVSMGGIRPVNKQLYEVGINTLPKHRREGWGTAVASAATQGALSFAPLVQWSAPLRNEPSQRIARRLGYQPYAHQLWLSPSDDIITGR